MVTIEEVRAFLDQFNTKVQVFGILFRDDRPKNREALQVLDITPLQRELVVKNLHGQTICISFHIAEHPLVYPFK